MKMLRTSDQNEIARLLDRKRQAIAGGYSPDVLKKISLQNHMGTK